MKDAFVKHSRSTRPMFSTHIDRLHLGRWLAIASLLVQSLSADDRPGRDHLRDAADKAANDAKTWKQDLPASVKDKKALLETKRDQLRSALRKELQKLGGRASQDQVSKTIDQFRSEHSEELAEQARYSAELTSALKAEATGDRSESMQEFRATRAASQRERRAARDTFHRQLEAAQSHAAKEELKENFREDQRAWHLEDKEALKKFRDEVRKQAAEGDRRLRD